MTTIRKFIRWIAL